MTANNNLDALSQDAEVPFSHPLSYDNGDFPAGAVNRAVSSHAHPERAD